MKAGLRTSYRACRKITRRSSSTFWLATLLFDLDTRRSLQALYAFCRVADDIVDSSDQSPQMKVQQLRLMRQAITHKRRVIVASEIWPAVFDTMRHHKLPVGEMETILRGVASDIQFRQPSTYEDLDEYSYRVAGAVGILSARILGAFKKSTLEGARQLGIAMQYTNIMRDVAADRELGRIYLPVSVMHSHKFTAHQLQRGENGAGLQATLSALASRAERYYQASGKVITDLHPSYQKPVRVAIDLYHEILERIKQKQYNVLAGRIRLNRREKIALVWRVYTKKD